ncbi:MAG: HEAT repeat protein, partial [Polyangiales bacterium]
AETLTAESDTEATSLRELLADGYLEADGRIQAYQRLAVLGDAQAVPLIIEGLSGSDEEPRQAALALARLGSPGADSARPALLAQFAESTDQERLAIAWTLVCLGDETVTDAALEGLESGRLQELDGYDAYLLADRLGTSGLLSALSDERSVIRHFGAEHLGSICDEGVVVALQQMVSDSDAGVVLAVTVSLARCGSPGALQSAAEVLTRNVAIRTPARTAFEYAVGAPGLGLLLEFASDDAAKIELLSLIQKSADPRAESVVLAELARDPEPSPQLRLKLVETLANVSSPEALQVAAPLMDLDDDDWTIAALRTLGASETNQDLEQTIASLLNRSSLRTAALDALARMRACSEETRLRVRRLSESPERIRYEGRCGGDPARAVALVSRGGETGRVNVRDGALRLAAYDAIAESGSEEFSNGIYEMMVDPTYDSTLRSASAHSLGEIADDITRRRLVDKALDVGGDDNVRAAAREVLRHALPPAAVDRLIGYLRTGQDDARTLYAVELLSLQGPGTAEAELRELLTDERAREHAALVLSFGGRDEATLLALTRLLSHDASLSTEVSRRARALRFYFHSSDFDEQFIQRGRYLLALQNAGHGDPLTVFMNALKEESNPLGTMSALEIRRALERLIVTGTTDERRIAAAALHEMGHNGPLLAYDGADRDMILGILR